MIREASAYDLPSFPLAQAAVSSAYTRGESYVAEMVRIGRYWSIMVDNG